MSMTYYHNPRCSKSRQGLQLLEENGVKPAIKEYLKEGLTKTEVKKLMKLTGLGPKDGLVRLKEGISKELDLKNKEMTKDQWAEVIAEHPVLLERPLLVNGDRAQIGRPPEDLLKIIE